MMKTKYVYFKQGYEQSIYNADKVLNELKGIVKVDHLNINTLYKIKGLKL